jgi:hypothetical protein
MGHAGKGMGRVKNNLTVHHGNFTGPEYCFCHTNLKFFNRKVEKVKEGKKEKV